VGADRRRPISHEPLVGPDGPGFGPIVDPSRLVIPGIRLPEMTLLMGRLIQPEAFGESSDEELVSR